MAYRTIRSRHVFGVVRHRSDAGRQLPSGKGLGDKMGVGIQDAPVRDHVGGIAGHEKGLAFRVDDGQAVGQFPAVHPGHDDKGLAPPYRGSKSIPCKVVVAKAAGG